MSSKLSDMKLPLILVLQIFLCLFFGHFIPTEVKSFCYALSLTIKALLMTVLPFIIFSFIAKSISDLGRGALTYIILLLTLVCSSNFIATCISGIVGTIVMQNGVAIQALQGNDISLAPMWNFQIPPLISNDASLFIGLLSGCCISFLNLQKVKNAIVSIQKASLFFLNKLFIRVIPIFILGFILKIQHEGLLEPILRDYSAIFLLITLCVYSYLFLLYGIASRFNPKSWFASIKNMLPAALIGFSAMSSAAAMPLILTGSEKNVRDPEVVRGAIPMAVNIHLIGCDFAIPMLSLAIMVSFGLELPDAMTYLIFTGYFVLAKFAVAAVPVGGIIIMLPVLEKYLGFNAEMLSLITALYILFDPMITSANVMGNGGFALLFSKLYSMVNPAKKTVKIA